MEAKPNHGASDLRNTAASAAGPAPEAFFIGDGGDVQAEPAESLADYANRELENVGRDGFFQKWNTFVLCLPWLLGGLQTMAYVFTSMKAGRRRLCHQQVDHCDLRPLLPGSCSVPRGDYEYTEPGHSVVDAFDLVCDAAFYVPLLGTLYFLGYMFGVAIFGAIADSRGRRVAYFWSLVGFQVGGLISCVAPFYSVYAFARCLTGFANGGLGLATYVWNAELISQQLRSTQLITMNTGFAVGVALLSPLSYFLPSWRLLSVALFLLGLPLFAFPYWIPESPLWLASQGDVKGVHSVLCRIATTNGREMPPVPSAKGNTGVSDNKDTGPTAFEALQLLMLDARLVRRFFLMLLAWFAVSLGYYGIAMNMTHLGGSIYLASAVSALVELPAYVLVLFSVDSAWVGRRGSTGGGLAVGGLCCILTIALMRPDHEANLPLLLLVLVGKFAVALGFAAVYLFAAELFPTSIRSQAIGLQSLAARVGGMLSPFIASLGDDAPALPLVLFGVPCAIAGLLLVLLPETLGQPMPGSVDDIALPEACPCVRICSRRYEGLEEATQSPARQCVPPDSSWGDDSSSSSGSSSSSSS